MKNYVQTIDELVCTCSDVNAGECEFCRLMEYEVASNMDSEDWYDHYAKEGTERDVPSIPPVDDDLPF